MSKKILVIDDEQHWINGIQDILETANYEVISATDGLEGFNKIKQNKPDLVILDVMLPKMDGYKICGLLKADLRYKEIPIILFSARAETDDENIAKTVGADAYLVKFKLTDLLEKVKELLRS